MTLFSLTYQWPHFPRNTEELLFGQISKVKRQNRWTAALNFKKERKKNEMAKGSKQSGHVSSGIEFITH